MNKDNEQREIKLRAWNSFTKEMWDCDHLVLNGIYLAPTGVGFVDVRNGNMNRMEELIPLRFIGLPDKNGKEIYEGDRLKVMAPFDDDDGDNEKIIEVVFKPGSGYTIEWSNGFCGGDADITTLGWAAEEGYEFEVIGHIYSSEPIVK